MMTLARLGVAMPWAMALLGARGALSSPADASAPVAFGDDDGGADNSGHGGDDGFR